MNPIVRPLVLTTGVLAVLLWERNREAANPPLPPNNLPVPVNPNGNNNLPPVQPNGAAGQLLTQFAALAQQAVTNPAGVNPTQVGLLAAQLRAAGATDQAQQLESVIGPAVCQAQGKGGTCWQVPITGGGPVATGPVGATVTLPVTPPAGVPASVAKTPGEAAALGTYQATIAAANANLAAMPLDRLQRFAAEARSSNFVAEAVQLDQLAQARSGLALSPVQVQALTLYNALISKQGKFEAPDIAALHDQLLAVGLPAQAENVARLYPAAVANPAKGTPAPNPAGTNPVPSTLPPAVAAQIQDALTNPAADPVKIDALVAMLQTNYPGGFLTQVTQLQKRAVDLRAAGR